MVRVVFDKQDTQIHWVSEGVPDRRHRRIRRQTFSQNPGKAKESQKVYSIPHVKFNTGGTK
jgi:hypothetical protein